MTLRQALEAHLKTMKIARDGNAKSLQEIQGLTKYQTDRVIAQATVMQTNIHDIERILQYPDVETQPPPMSEELYNVQELFG
jgi:hypothetical protein